MLPERKILWDEKVDFSKMTAIEKINFVKQVLNRQKALGETIPIVMMRAKFMFEINRLYFEKIDEIALKLTGEMTGNEIIDTVVSFFEG